MKKIISLVICCMILTGCMAFQVPLENSPSTTVPTTFIPTTPSSTVPSTTMLPSSSNIPPVDIFFRIYAPNESFDGFVSFEALSSYPLKPNQIMDWLREATDFYEGVIVNSAIMENNTLRLDVNDAFYKELLTMGTTGEKLLIGCLVNTFLSAYGADRVLLTADGEVMNSGHVVYDFPLSAYK